MSEMNQNNNGPVKGAIHSIESFGSVDGPWRTLRDFCEGLQHAPPVLPQPGHLDNKKMPTGRPQTRCWKSAR